MRGKLAAFLAFVSAGVQFLQPSSIQPGKAAPVLAGAEPPAEVLQIVQRSCQDCHSWNTDWPWYAQVSPLSWMIARDVERGRGFLNLSEWQNYPRSRKLAMVAAVASAVNQNRMPPAPYLLMHPEARLSDADRKVLKSWSRAEFRRLRTRRSSNLPPS